MKQTVEKGNRIQESGIRRRCSIIYFLL